MKQLEELKEYHNISIDKELQRVELLDTLHGDYCHGPGAPTSYYCGAANYQTISGSDLPVEKDHGYYHDQLYISFEALGAMDEAQWVELTEMLGALSGYPVLDDELLSRLEHEAIIEYLASDGIDDLIREIERRETDIPFCMPDLSAADCYNLLQALNIEIGSDCGHAIIYFNAKKAADELLQRWNDYRIDSLILSSARGIYIPRDFATGYGPCVKGDSLADDLACLECGPDDNEDYWGAWDRVLDNAVLVDTDGREFTLLNGVDGDVFLLNDRTEIDFIKGLTGDPYLQAEVDPCDKPE